MFDKVPELFGFGHYHYVNHGARLLKFFDGHAVVVKEVMAGGKQKDVFVFGHLREVVIVQQDVLFIFAADRSPVFLINFKRLAWLHFQVVDAHALFHQGTGVGHNLNF